MEDRGAALPAELVDHNALVGPYPYRRLPDPTPERLVADLERLGIARAWVGHVPSIYYRDVAAGNDELLRWLEPHRARLLPVPAVNPGVPRLGAGGGARPGRGVPRGAELPGPLRLRRGGARDARARRVRAPISTSQLLLTVRVEDGRQRHRLDVAAELLGADVRAAVRANPGLRLLVTNADRGLIEEVHFGSTPPGGGARPLGHRLAVGPAGRPARRAVPHGGS